MIRKLSSADFKTILKVINKGAQAYQGVIPDDRGKGVYLSEEELKEEMEAGVQFYGWTEDNRILGVMGIQPFPHATLIRHAYVLPKHQREDIGGKLLEHLISITENDEILADPWKAATWAISFYQQHGFQRVNPEEKIELLKKYWNAPKKEIENSVVLRLNKK